MELEFGFKILISVAVIGFFGLVVLLYDGLVVKPQRLRSKLKKQGVDGPKPSFLLGNLREIRKAQASVLKVQQTPIIHNTAAQIFPFYEQWKNQYGQVFVFSLGNLQILNVNQPEIVKEITTCTSMDFGKPSYQHKERGALLGQGILTSNGAIWAHQRKILAPELYMDKVKGMVKLINESTKTMINSWKEEIEAKGGIADIKIDEGLRSFSGDVISRACFGSNYTKGEKIFLKLRALQKVMSKKALGIIPGMRYLPTKHNREAWALEKGIRNLIIEVVTERQKATDKNNDLLQMVLEGAKTSKLKGEAMNRFIVDNCKNIYLAGFETTAVAATWTLMLLAANQDWQDRVRAEVLEICGGGMPDYEMVRKMKLLNMVIHESLRLYPPVPIISREAFQDMKFGNINAPKGVNVWTMVTPLHTDPEIWGTDSYNFNPQRFANGIAGACKFPYSYMPFGVGPRVCLGQNLALVELKILIALILCNFSFSLSPKYIHSPVIRLVIEPENGVNLLIKKL
ncbi:hypothetical protein JCGZ_17273 [Jatropha curcas]|uniref:Cytochrome P450 n=1 Tax=Jatropha curcas TaxID=180498 RepID=A0A067LB23_JATCU|nr:cytochrome P450 714C2 [Jatropha curcas]KDP45666.1 hypothetical protein JCGZ_17273 [Jatropha curcas]